MQKFSTFRVLFLAILYFKAGKEARCSFFILQRAPDLLYGVSSAIDLMKENSYNTDDLSVSREEYRRFAFSRERPGSFPYIFGKGAVL